MHSTLYQKMVAVLGTPCTIPLCNSNQYVTYTKCTTTSYFSYIIHILYGFMDEKSPVPSTLSEL
jgi:hypothetical protein